MLYALSFTLFLSAFLLFCCQPMVGKMVLPILGGAAAVWTTCVLFFQIMLLAGYLYAHFLVKMRRLKDQILVHLSLLAAGAIFLPMRISGLSGNPMESPVVWLLQNLLFSIGLPFAVISATAPLLQTWLATTRLASGRDPYFLYAISNAGSLIALAIYPLLIEPRYGVTTQSAMWLAGYAGLLVMFVFTARLVWKQSMPVKIQAGISRDSLTGQALNWKTRLYWLGAAFVPSALMLAVTNHISMNIGSFPFLWVVPLAIYLLTFIMAFARRIRIPTPMVSAATTLVLLVLFPITSIGVSVGSVRVWILIGCHLIILFAGSLLCHSALADRRPSTKFLTEFYFIVALGGVLGGAFAAIVAPSVFNTVLEYPLLVVMIICFRSPGAARARFNFWDVVDLVTFGLLLTTAIFAIRDWARVDVAGFDFTWNDNNLAVVGTQLVLILSVLLFRKRHLEFFISFSLLVVSYAILLPKEFEGASRVHVARDFFGVKKVLFEEDINMRKLVHGDTMHGRESLSETLAGIPLSYYHRSGPVGDVMELIADRLDQRVAVVGLGTGTIAAYGRPNRRITFFDIDPQVAEIAKTYFTFLRRCGNDCDTVIGDGRLGIQSRPDAMFDLLILDAFNSDSIPGHLVSREAVRMYMTKLKPNGVLMFHVSNRYLDVEKLVVAALSDEDIPAFSRFDDDDSPVGKSRSHYVIAVRQPEDLKPIPSLDQWTLIDRSPDFRAWTDDFSNMLSILK